MSVSATPQPAQTTPSFQRRGLSLRLRLSLLVLSTALIVFVVVGAAIYAEAQSILTQNANEKLKASTTTLANNVAIWLDLNTRALAELASLPAITSMEAAQQKPYLEAMGQAYKDMYLVSTTDLAGLNVERSDGQPATDYKTREWFQGARNGAAITYETRIGATSKRPALVAASPIISNNRTVGVAMFATNLPNIVDAVNINQVGETGQVYVIDAQNRAVAFVDPDLPQDQINDLSARFPVQALRSGIHDNLYVYTDAQGEQWHAFLTTLPDSWGIIVQQKESEFLSPLRRFQVAAGIVFGLGAVILAALTWFAIGRALKPIQEVANVAGVAASGNLNVTVPVKRHDEVGALAAAFNTMIARLHELIDSLELRIHARTEQLQASAEVGRAAVSILDTNQLLREIVNLITDRFGFYYAAVFLADNTNQWAVLHEATGNAGRVLKERQHQLEIGGQSMVGSAMKTRKARIALDVGDEAVRFANPLLPDTRSEIALPLMVGSRVLGALDVQSTQMAAFDEANASVLQSMADQIAIALSNTMLFQQTQAGLQRTRQLYEASTAISNATDAPGILRELMTKAVPEADAAQILTYGPRDEDGHYAYFEVAASWAHTGNDLSLPIGTRVGPTQVPSVPALANEPYLICDATDPATTTEQQQIMRAMHMRALLGYALVAGSQPVGLLLIVFREPRLFPTTETQPLQALTGQVAVTLRNQQLVRDEAAAVQQLDEINRRLTGEAWEEYARTIDAVIYKEDAGPTANAWIETMPAVLSAPITIHGEEVGVLRLEDTTPDREWTPGELGLARAVAGEVAIALENARLIEETEKRARRERTINRITSRIRNAPSIEQMLAVAAQELRVETHAARSIAEIAPEADGQEDERS
jgi:GAF domain-containing protein/HAMP domain-containing protein